MTKNQQSFESIKAKLKELQEMADSFSPAMVDVTWQANLSIIHQSLDEIKQRLSLINKMRIS